MKYNYKILIIDDNIIDQIVTKQLLKKKLNLTETYAVSSGKDGIVWLENFHGRRRQTNHFIRHQNA
jgi:CheY-like chemotaxis protein